MMVIIVRGRCTHPRDWRRLLKCQMGREVLIKRRTYPSRREDNVRTHQRHWRCSTCTSYVDNSLSRRTEHTDYCHIVDSRAVQLVYFGGPQITASGRRSVAPDFLRLTSLKAFQIFGADHLDIPTGSCIEQVVITFGNDIHHRGIGAMLPQRICERGSRGKP